MKREILILALIALIATHQASASLFNSKDLTLSLDQKDYYFLVGENAVIPLHSENTYGKTLNGMLIYSITQQISQQGFQFSSSNTQSTSLSIPDGKKDFYLNFGTSQSPATYKVGIKFQYNENGPREVSLEDITIHFVSQEAQKQNTNNEIKSSSREVQQNQQTQQTPNTFKSIQQQMNNMFGKQQTLQQRIQNNQIGQDSQALKHQIQKQLSEEQQTQKNFEKQLGKNPEFQAQHEKILNSGYNLTNANIYPESNNTGDFELTYKKQDGKEATLKGRMENGKIKWLPFGEDYS